MSIERSPARQPLGVYNHGRLPHFDLGARPQFVTFRLADSIPKAVLQRWEAELAALPDGPRRHALLLRVEHFVDGARGSCVLGRPDIARIVIDRLRHRDGADYDLHGFVVMPNHVHVIFTPRPHEQLGRIVKAWKAFSARFANERLGTAGAFWAADYYDRFIRDERHFATVLKYVAWNPVKAGLCRHPQEWEANWVTQVH